MPAVVARAGACPRCTGTNPMDGSWFTRIDYWGWWLIGLVFIIIEILAPGIAFMWLAAAAFIVGTVVLLIPEIPWQLQGALFALLSVVSLVVGRAYLRRNPIQTEDATLNRRGHQYVGRTFTLEQPIVNGKGKIKVDDTTWRIEGEDMGIGTKVTVTGVDGVVLVVEEAG